MAKQKLWYKKRTTRGGARRVVNKPRLSRKNIESDVYKNQRLYSHFFLRFVLFAILGAVWIKLPGVIHIGNFAVDVFPIGLVIGIVFACFERFRMGRHIEIGILAVMATISYFLPIAIAL